MKKGISLIVLVITIIVMIIIAGAIIISLNSSNVIDQSNKAVKDSDEANARSVLALKYAEILAAHYAADPTVTYVPAETTATKNVPGKTDTATDISYLQAAITALTDDNEGWTVVVTETGYDLQEKTTTTNPEG